jgi:hypothetical protein
MRDALKAQASSKATLVGRRAGGTSNVKAQRVPKGSGQKPKFTKPDNVTPLKKALARPSKLFPRGGQLIPQPWSAPPYFPSAIRSQGRHRGIEAGLGQRGHVFETAYRNEIVRRGLNPNEYPGQRVVDEVLEVAQRATMRHYNNTQPPQRDWSRTDARTERIRARGGELQPLRQRGPQDPQLRARWQASQGNQAPRSVGAMGAPAPTRKELPKVNRPGTIRSNKAARNSLKVAPAVKPPSALRRVGGVAGKAIGPAFAAWDYADRRSQGQSRSQAATGTGLGTVGGWGGAVAGAKAGATAGALLGPKGAAVGGLVGGIAGGMGGYEALNKVNDRIYQEGQKRKNPPKPTPKPLYGTGRVASIVPTRPQPQPQQKSQAKPSEAEKLKVKKRR